MMFDSFETASPTSGQPSKSTSKRCYPHLTSYDAGAGSHDLPPLELHGVNAQMLVNLANVGDERDVPRLLVRVEDLEHSNKVVRIKLICDILNCLNRPVQPGQQICLNSLSNSFLELVCSTTSICLFK